MSLCSDSFRKKRSNLLLALVFIALSSSAQTNDFQQWEWITIKSDISKKFSASVQCQMRVIDNSTKVGTLFLEPNIGYKINKYLRIGVGYRYSFRAGNSGLLNRTAQRYNIDLEGRKKFGKFTLKLRTRFQQGFMDFYMNENRAPGSYPIYNRNKFGIDYQFNKIWSLFTEFELYLPLNKPQQRNFDRFRFTLGSSLDLKNRNTLDCFFRIQKQLNTANPETDFIIGLGYAYDVKLSKKKKKDKDKKDEKNKKEKE